MLTLIWNAISGNKLVSYAIFTVSLVAIGLTAFRYIEQSGADKAQSKQLRDALNSLKQEYKHRAEIDRLAAADARRLLRERWSRS